MTMRFKQRCVCQTIPEEERDTFLFKNGICWLCNGKGENEYDLNLDHIGNIEINLDSLFPVKFYSDTPEESTDATILYDDIAISIRCSCGDEVFFGDMYSVKVCSCGRVYHMDVDISKDDTHKGDMQYWDKVKSGMYEKNV